MERIKLGHRKILEELRQTSFSILRGNFYYKISLKLPIQNFKNLGNLSATIYPSQITDKIYSMFVKGTP